jgi:hypothetical protein
MMRVGNLVFVLTITAGIFARSIPVHGTAAPMSTKEMVAAAEQILFATVEKIVQPDPSRYLIEVHLKPAQVMKGKVEGEEFVLNLVGGVVNGIGLFSSEDPQFKVGKPVVIFLQTRAYPRAPVVGGKQGCFHVQQGRVIEKRMGIETFLGSIRAEVAEKAQGIEKEPIAR